MGATLFPRGGTTIPPGTTGQTLFPRGYTVTPPGTTGQTLSPSGQTGLPTVPGVPTGVSAVAGNAQCTVSFTAPVSDGGSAITGYTVTSSPGGITGTGAASPIIVTGLANGTEYTFTVHATNAIGNSAESAASSPVTPAALLGPTVKVTLNDDVFDALTGQTVTFIAIASARDPGATIVSYLWDNSDTGPTSKRVYSYPGPKTATCIVTDSNGKRSQAALAVVNVVTTPSYIDVTVTYPAYPSWSGTWRLNAQPSHSWTEGGRTVYARTAGAPFWVVAYNTDPGNPSKWHLGFWDGVYKKLAAWVAYAVNNGQDYPPTTGWTADSARDPGATGATITNVEITI